MVRVQQLLWGAATDHQHELPGQIIGILQARIGTAGPKRRDLMGSIPDKKHSLVPKIFHPPTLKGVHTDPLKIKRVLLTQHRSNTRNYFLRLFFLLGVRIPAQLKVNAPNIIGSRCSSTD